MGPERAAEGGDAELGQYGGSTTRPTSDAPGYGHFRAGAFYFTIRARRAFFEKMALRASSGMSDFGPSITESVAQMLRCAGPLWV